METFRIENLSFSYPGQGRAVLDDLSADILPGQFVTLCGPSGCGKSTLLRQLKTVLAPCGRRSGSIYFEGAPLDQVDQGRQAAAIGFVQQSPENQIVTDKVWHELAFGLESLGYDNQTIRSRVAEMASFFGIQTWFYKDTARLSGGQKQLLNLASIMVMHPSVLILDEPTSQLDPIAASDFLTTVGRINREFGTTVILTEHRLEEVFPLSDRVLVMDRGKITADGTPSQVGMALKKAGNSMFLAMPAAMRVWAATDDGCGECPVTVRDGRDWLERYSKEHELKNPEPEDAPAVDGEAAVELRDVWFRYEKDSDDVVKGLDLKLRKGEFLAVLGGNGTGKSTAVALAGGLRKPYRGKVVRSGRTAILPQNPQTLFVKKTVMEDLTEMIKEKDGGREKLERMISLCRLSELRDRHPYDLSGGEQQRVALAKVLLTDPDILLLDEPTKGLDAEFKQVFASVIRSLQDQDVSVLMVSHDVEFCAEYADRCALFFDGSIVSEGRPVDFFSGNSFYTTAANRMARGFVWNTVTVSDLIRACGGTVSEYTALPYSEPPGKRAEEKLTAEKQPSPKTEKSKLPKRTVISAAISLLMVPATILAGVYLFGDRKYYLISLLVLLEIMIPFALVFEGKKPQARELVLIASLCAIGVAGRAVFFMIPSFKPVMALVIISGVALGGETGFLVGAMTMLVSNVMFGQGPWTPWQMFAMGLIGFVAGIMHRAGFLPAKRLPLCIFGALSTIIIFGGIMNPASALMWTTELNRDIVLSYCISGLPMDLVHAAATVLILWFAGEAMLEKLGRIRVKYGIAEYADK